MDKIITLHVDTPRQAARLRRIFQPTAQEKATTAAKLQARFAQADKGVALLAQKLANGKTKP